MCSPEDSGVDATAEERDAAPVTDDARVDATISDDDSEASFVDCGTCTSPAVCDGGGDSQCGTSAAWEQEAGTIDAGSRCVPQTCAQLGYTCGENGDGCYGTLNCGTCTSPAVCGGGGYSRCGPPCVPKTCAQLGYNCGFAGDGCGNQLNCGAASACTQPAYCGGGGANVCGGSVLLAADGGLASNCTPETCAELGYNCGLAGDGCGNQIDCGGTAACATPEYCGGGGANVCGGSVFVAADGGTVTLCTPKTCAELGYTCGSAADECGNLLQCGTCTSPQYCGGAGPNQCGASD